MRRGVRSVDAPVGR